MREQRLAGLLGTDLVLHSSKPETKAGEKEGGAGIPWIRDYESARAVVKRPEMSCLFALGDTHRNYLARSFDQTGAALASTLRA